MVLVKTLELREKVQEVYRKVATRPKEKYHFEMGRALAEKLGYPSSDLDAVPQEALESFAGVGYHFDLAEIRPGEAVLDLGSGSGTDSFVAALKVGQPGRVVGVDMTQAQLEKASRLKEGGKFSNVSFQEGFLEKLPLDPESFDAVISNGVVNLCPSKELVFGEAARVLKPGGRLALSDIVSEKELPADVTCDADIWASCVGGAIPEKDYHEALGQAGFRVLEFRENPQYAFISDSARDAQGEWGVKSVSLLAAKKGRGN